MFTRRQALVNLLQFLAASPLLRADRKFKDLGDPILDTANVFDLAKLAKAKLDPLAWDYMDEGSDDDTSLRDNRRKFDDIVIRPHQLRNNVSQLDISTTLFGKKLDHPIFICPTGGKNCFFHNGEQEVAIGAGNSRTMMITNGGINPFLASGKGPKVWWQFTTAAEFRSKSQMADFAEKLQDQGATGISVTVDIYVVSHRERSIHNRLVRSWCNANGIPRNANGQLIYNPDDMVWTAGDFPRSRPFPTPTWDTLQRLRESSGSLPVIVKGVLTAEDTQKAVQSGLSGVIVSNHGARQLDQVGATIEALPECVQAAGGKIPVMIDGGFRRGTDIFKALALGASAVGIGRPYLWGLGAFGHRGVERVIELLRAELALDMGMAGAGNISQIDRSFVRLRKG
ncbi:MAG TPA: alpha-hydroxy acid oxidase [Bryobacterales bacterium]|nr:alpha-hydroxy acid oxidase [Bryobacterales bacterium]